MTDAVLLSPPGAVRVGLVDREVVINPTRSDSRHTHTHTDTHTQRDD